MQPTLDGYRVLDTLRRTANRVVYLAIRESDQRKVVAKVHSIVGASGLEDRVKHEFELIRALDLPGVVRALDLERRGATLVLTLDWFDGVSLEQHCRDRTLGLDECLRIAHSLAEILATVHERRVIHRDIKPGNILVSARNGEVMLADFGISVLLESERGQIHDPEVLEGTLPFLSPEQTGRTGRTVDFRIDLYSLGVTLYELLTGRRPFTEHNPLELIHAHLARRPATPRSLRPELPGPISALVMKLLEKAPERRYQSARALAQDLAQLIDRRKRSQSLDDFELGHGTSSVLQLPHGLYGRAIERDKLLALVREAATDTSRVAIVRGPPGIGKSALIDELGEPVIARQGFLARGKFEGDTVQPLSGILQAMSSLADQLLTEPDHRLAAWLQQIEAALGSLADVVVTLEPKFAAIIAGSATPTELTVIESRNRVVQGLTRLLTVVARPQHPLVLALDDLQWADPASIEFIVELLSGQHPGLVVIVTCRDHATGAAQVQELDSKLRARGLVPLTITLAPLHERAMAEMIADTLSMTTDEVAGLVPIIRRKTDNNPFFARQFLLHLAEMELLRVGPRGWTWNTAELDAATLPEDTLELMTAKLERLDPAAGWLIDVASVLGLRFRGLAAIAVANAQSSALVVGAPQLHALLDQGLIFGIEGDYQFVHGRIREAAYARLDADTCRSLHLRVGEYLLGSLDGPSIDARVFELVAHLDRGHGLSLAQDTSPMAELDRVLQTTDADARERLARLNLRAGEAAMAAGAPKSARRYLEIGVGLSSARLPALEHPDHARLYSALRALGSARMLAGDFDAAEELLDGLHAQPLTPGEYGGLIHTRCICALLRDDIDRAVQIGVEGLRGLGVSFPRRVDLLSLVGSIVALIWTMRGSPLERLDPEPVRDPRARAAIELAGAVGFFGYFSSPQTWIVLIQRHAALVMRHGSHPTALLAIISAALLVSIVLGRRSRSRMLAIADAALELDARTGPNIRRHSLLLSASSLQGWTVPSRELAERQAGCVKLALEAGDLTAASFHSLGSVTHAFLAGQKLPALHERCVQHKQQVMQWGTRGLDSTAILDATRVYIHGPIPEPGELEPFEIPHGSKGLGKIVIHEMQLFAAQLLYLFGRRAEALHVLDVAGPPLERYMRGTHVIPPLVLFVGLAAAAAIPRLHGRARWRRARQLRQAARRFRRDCEAGGRFEYERAILEAELAVIDGAFELASRNFEQARSLAAEQQNLWREGLAHERMAELARARGLDAYALTPILRARSCYQQWGADAKVLALDQAWQLDVAALTAGVTNHDISSISRSHGTSISSTTTSLAVDMASLLKISQAISDHIRLDEVLTRIMVIAIENAGADRGALLLTSPTGLTLVAECDVEGNARAFGTAPRPLTELATTLPTSLLRWVERTGEAVVLAEAGTDRRFAADAYLRHDPRRSILCLPIRKLHRLIGLLYLENRLSMGSFTLARVEVLELIIGQAASALENARLYEALRGSETRWRSLIERMPGIVALLDRTGQIQFAGPLEHAGERIATVGRNFTDLVSSDDRERFTRHLGVAFAGEAGAGTGIELDANLSGSPRWSVHLAPVREDAGIERVILVAIDVSQRRRAEQANAELERQVREQQRLEAIGTLASGVAHEINNPIQGIMNYADLIAMSAGIGPEPLQLAGEIVHECDRVTGIVRNLLAFARQERTEYEWTQVSEIIDGTRSLMQVVLRRDHILLDIDIPPGLPTLRCRSQQIQQVVMNFVTNARDALNARYPDPHDDKRISIGASLAEDGRTLRIHVEDRGGGVPEQHVARIFDPFFTTKGREQGTGLGLSVSRGIVSEHGGELTLENRPGVGARFVISLPVDASALEAAR